MQLGQGDIDAAVAHWLLVAGGDGVGECPGGGVAVNDGAMLAEIGQGGLPCHLSGELGGIGHI